MTITYRAFESSDLDDVLTVMRRSLGSPPGLDRTSELFGWKHLENPFGRSIMLVAQDGSRVVGFRAFMRWHLVSPNGSTLRCVRPVDTATDPDYQRRGIFSELTRLAVDAARSDNVDLIFNTPNPQSGAGYVKMGWTIAGQFGVMVRPSLRPRADQYLVGRDSPHDLGGTDRPPLGLRTARSDEYRAWRFRSHPTAEYVTHGGPEGMLVCRQNVRRGRRELVVSEVIGNTHDAFRGVGRRIRSHYAVAWFKPGSPERRAAIQSGFLPLPRVKSLTLAVQPLRQLEIDPNDLSNWDVGFGDLELL